MSTHLDLENPPGWYLYRFKTRILCALGAGCQRRHPMYVGISNEPWRREKEHQQGKGWYRHTCGWEVDEREFATEEGARAAERVAILAELPLANDVHNGDNPHRLVFPKTNAARARRPVTPGRPHAPVASPARRLSRRQQGFAAVAATWAALSAAGWWAASAYLGLVGWSAPLVACFAALLLLAVAALFVAEFARWWNSRRARRQRRRLVLRVTALTAAAGVAAVLYLTMPALLAHLPAQAR